MRKYGELKGIYCRTMEKITQQATSYLFVWGVKRGVWGLWGWLQGHQHRRLHAHVPINKLLREQQTRIVLKYSILK